MLNNNDLVLTNKILYDEYVKKSDFYKVFIIQKEYSIDSYIKLLKGLYFLVKETPNFLTSAASHSGHNRKVQNWFLNMAVEERGHDKLCLIDLKNLGCETSLIEIEMHNYFGVKCLNYQNFYWARSQHPEVLLGFALVTENLGAFLGKEIYQLLKNHYHYSKKALSFFEVHSFEDIKHLDSIYGCLNEFIPNYPEKNIVCHIMEDTYKSYVNFLDSTLK